MISIYFDESGNTGSIKKEVLMTRNHILLTVLTL